MNEDKIKQQVELDAKGFVASRVPAHAERNDQQKAFSEWFIFRSDYIFEGVHRRWIIGMGNSEAQAWREACKSEIVLKPENWKLKDGMR